jgi:hypothetical protein
VLHRPPPAHLQTLTRSASWVALLLSLAPQALAQAEPAPSPPSEPPPAQPVAPEISSLPSVAAAPSAPTADQLEALRAELARQAAELAAQRAELDRLAQASDAELLGGVELDPERYEERVRFYGFMDMGLQKMWLGASAVANPVMESTASTFVLGNVNLYMDAHPLERWRALVEVRLTTYPHGQFTLGAPGQPFERTSTRISDANSSSGGWAQLNWGSIALERAQIEWSGTDWLNVRIGYWLTPYGIWNVDHGSPTLIALNEPQFVIFEAFPTRQVGVDVNGVLHATPWDLEYHLYVSNGRTPGQLDLSDDKMIGTRLVARTSAPFPLALGASGFYGRLSDKEVNLTALAPLTVARNEVVAGSELGLSGDVSADVGPLRFRSELVLTETRFDTGKHPQTFGLVQPSKRSWSAYGLLAYQAPWAGLEPYAYLEYNRDVLPFSQVVMMMSLGLNVHFTAATQLKIQYSRDEFFDVDELGRDFADMDIDFLASRLVVSF